jgi:hypothetical protein
VEVPVPRPRDAAQMESTLFMATRQHLERLIHQQRKEDMETLPMVRMALAGDDVE